MHTRTRLLFVCCCFFVFLPRNLGAQIAEVGFPVTAFAAADGPDRLLAIGGHNVAILSADELKVVKQISLDAVRVADARMLENKSVLVSGTIDSEDGYLALHTFGEQPTAWQHTDLDAPIVCMCLVGKNCLVGDDEGKISAFDVVTGQRMWSEPVHSKMVTCISSLTPELCVSSDWVGKIVLFDLASGKEQANFQQHRDRVSQLVADLSANRPRLFSSSRDGTVRLWYPTQSRLVRFANLERPLTAMTLLSDSIALVATSDAELVKVDMNTAKVKSEIECDCGYVQVLYTLDQDHVYCSDGRHQVFRLNVQ